MRYAKIRRDEQERHSLQEYIFELEEVQDQAAELAIAHEQVKRSQVFLDTVLSCTTHGLCLVRNRTFVWCNRVFTEILGWEPDELRGQSTEITYPDNHEYEKMGKVVYGNLEQQGSIIYEYDFVHKRGHRVPCLVSGRALDENKPSKGYIFSITDFSERKQAQEALQKAYDKLEELNAELLLTNEQLNRGAEEAQEKSLKELRQSLEGTVVALANTVEMRDPYIAGHQRRVAQLACALAQEMGFSPDQLEGIRVMGSLHDIGKIGIPAEILTKPGRLNEFEANLVKTHAQIGYAILKDLKFPWPVAQAILQHHERLNGSGYPSGLSDREIIPEARILAVADVVEAMASYRPYRPAVGIDQALEEISRNRGTLYDPEVVDICLRVFTEKSFKFDIDKQSFPDP
jgi:PAS domain S-box-containing protein/putative nucleotidyltransferase with HDIG domain